jgi:hypothetical protein
MKDVHCRQCWQPISRLHCRCPQCGQVDRFRYGWGLAEVGVYLGVATAAIALAFWAIRIAVRGLV